MRINKHMMEQIPTPTATLKRGYLAYQGNALSARISGQAVPTATQDRAG